MKDSVKKLAIEMAESEEKNQKRVYEEYTLLCEWEGGETSSQWWDYRQDWRDYIQFAQELIDSSNIERYCCGC